MAAKAHPVRLQPGAAPVRARKLRRSVLVAIIAVLAAGAVCAALMFFAQQRIGVTVPGVTGLGTEPPAGSGDGGAAADR
ncbi:hypothetical protein V8J36_09060 [Frigidibacter sp. MR17.14]|uniref:hypothetical protein n=1 Tax=Frigidibacter sp. MR17.14 TaxID=3126509 RepID=UPI003012A32E